MKLLSLLAFLFVFFSVKAQTALLEGKVTDSQTGSVISGVSVSINGESATVISNVDGGFAIKLRTGKTYSIRLTSVGYQSKEVDDIQLVAGKITSLYIVLDRVSKTEQSVVVRSSARKETIAALISYQKNTSVVAQVVSAEAIKRSPDKNTGEVLKRVPGISLQEGKYIVVRGLADRYNQAMLNGILLSSTEPDRKTFSFDILPSAMIENIIVNKSFIPELPGEWAGGLIQVNTKDVPAKDFFSVQIGTGFNTQTIGKDFYNYKGSNTDFLGFDNGTRSLPGNLPGKATFATLSQEQKTSYAEKFENIWNIQKYNSNVTSVLNQAVVLSGGFNVKLGSKSKLAAIVAINYSRTNKRTEFLNQVNTFQDNIADLSFDYSNTKYNKDILAGALANFTLQLGNNSKISFRNMLNVNTANYTTIRKGKDFDAPYNTSIGYDNISASELAFKANTFFNTQLNGDHNIQRYKAKLHWFGSFNILDQYIPDQRRLQYVQEDASKPEFLAAIGSSNASQKSGSRYYGFLNDYVYTSGADLSKVIKTGKSVQTIKGGYFFQVKDRLFDSRPFAIYLPSGNRELRLLSANNIFNPENFGNGSDNKFAFNELSGPGYRYIANSILNAGFLQLDNQVTKKLRAVWGIRVENFDQVIGSMKESDPRHVHNVVTDYLPALNLTYKVDPKINVRLSGSQTIIRPEFRELSTFQFYDFDLGATVAGYSGLMRTKVSNFDLRYEIYPRGGELVTFGVFYKYFNKPIEAYFNPSSGGASTYNFLNANEANSFGAELEFRKKLDACHALKNFTMQGNVSYIYNRVTGLGNDESRPMQGQSPYLLNASIQYDLEKYGINTTLLFNQIGRRIAFVGGSDQPPIWENPRPILDLQLAKKIFNKGEFKINMSDILNRPAIFYNDLNSNKRYDKNNDAFAIKRKYGTNVSISLGYNF
ncbi:MAG: TonB-dependent receptor [Ferruginibacter sp.]